MRFLLLLAAAASLAGQSPQTPPCTEDKRSECWIEAANRPGCQFWYDGETPSLKAYWSGECPGGLAEGRGTLTWRVCFWDNGACMPVEIEQSGSFLNGRKDGQWIDGPLDAASCHRWNTDMYFMAATVQDVTACLEAGADVNAYKSGYSAGTPLHRAVRKNDLPMIEVLLDAGADVDARDGGGGTPLHVAANYSDKLAVSKVLLAAGADVNARDSNWNTPLHELARFNHPLGDQSVELARILIDAGANVETRQRHGNTPLHYAARREEIPIVEVLLEAGADVHARNDDGETPLIKAVGEMSDNRTDVVEMLLAAGADAKTRTEDGRTLLHYVRNDGIPEVYNVLLDAGADLEARDNEGKTPLHRAARFGGLGRAKLEWLLAAGADLEARDNEGNTPLHAVFESKVRTVPKELPKGLQPESVEMEFVKVLIKAGANLEARNNEANTPLHLAAKYIFGFNGAVYGFNEHLGVWHPGHTGPHPQHAGDAIRILLAAGADPSARNGEGETPCDLYRRNIFLRAEKVAQCQ